VTAPTCPSSMEKRGSREEESATIDRVTRSGRASGQPARGLPRASVRQETLGATRMIPDRAETRFRIRLTPDRPTRKTRRSELTSRSQKVLSSSYSRAASCSVNDRREKRATHLKQKGDNRGLLIERSEPLARLIPELHARPVLE